MYNYTHTYLFFILCIQLRVARMQTKFFRSWPHHVKDERSAVGVLSVESLEINK
jgi:hypothetical protein